MSDEQKRGPGRPPSLHPVKLLRGYFPEGGKKVLVGEIIQLPREEAIRLIDLKIAERADPL